MDILSVNVFFPWGDTETFSCRLHRAEDKSQLLMDPGFYEEMSWTRKVPDFPHYEMELTTNVWTNDPDKKIHWRESDKKPGTYLVCLTAQVPSIEVAKRWFLVWCAGTGYTMLTNESFDKKHEGISDTDFFKFLENNYGILVKFAK